LSTKPRPRACCASCWDGSASDARHRDPFTARQKIFIAVYLGNGGNGAAAARAAGYSERAAPEQASRLLANRKIREEIERRRSRLASRDDAAAAVRRYLNGEAVHGGGAVPEGACRDRIVGGELDPADGVGVG
jgi:hypothetical protein